MTVPIPSRVSSSPVLNDTVFLDNGGQPLINGHIFTYEAGGFTVEQTTFTDSTGSVANTNPIVLDSSGRMQTGLWLADGYAYNFTVCNNSNVVFQSFSNIVGSSGVTAGGGTGTVIWNTIGVSPVYVSANQFYVVGDFTTHFKVGNRVQWQYSDLTYGYGVITASVLSTGNTYVTVLVDSVSLSATIINVQWSALVVTNYTVDAGAVGYTDSFTYSGANVGTQLQATGTLLTNYQRSYSALLTGTNYAVTTQVGFTSYSNMVLDVIFDTAVTGATTINVDNIGPVSLMMFDNTGTLVDPINADGWCSRLVYNGTAMVMVDQLPYTPPATPPPSFITTMGTVSPASGTFDCVAGTSGTISVMVGCYAHALFGNFGQGTFTLYESAVALTTATTRFFEWDSRTGAGNPTLLCAFTGTPGTTYTFTVTYAGQGQAEDCNWMCVTA